jgi:hypothetical protein
MTDTATTPTVSENGAEAAPTTQTAEEAKNKAAAYNAALSRLREAHRAELDTFAQEEFDKRGLVWKKRLSENEKAEKALADLLSTHPELRNKFGLPDTEDAQPVV